MRAMFNEAQFTWPLRRNMWAYAALLVTKLDNILLRPDMGSTPYELFLWESTRMDQAFTLIW
jgi:hypothetical protein